MRSSLLYNVQVLRRRRSEEAGGPVGGALVRPGFSDRLGTPGSGSIGDGNLACAFKSEEFNYSHSFDRSSGVSEDLQISKNHDALGY